MKDFLILVGQILLIACVQTLTEIFINPGERPYQARVLNIACFVGSLYLLLQFIVTHLFSEIASVIKFPF